MNKNLRLKKNKRVHLKTKTNGEKKAASFITKTEFSSFENYHDKCFLKKQVINLFDFFLFKNFEIKNCCTTIMKKIKKNKKDQKKFSIS